MTNLSFFAKKARYENNYKHLLHGSSLIRAEQMSEYLGAKFNPAGGYENDVCIYIKPSRLLKFAKNSYIDIVDANSLSYIRFLEDNPQLSVIAASQYSYEYLSKSLKKVVLIPQQHCNFENILRHRKEINTVGIIGGLDAFQYSVEDTKEKLKKIGINLINENFYSNRADVVDFYKKIDIQITWRPIPHHLKNAMKLYNAASFGIPTVGYPELANKEFEGYYIQATTIDQLIDGVKKLKDNPEYYNEFSKKIVKKAAEYHISKIAKLYKNLA